MVWLRVLLNRLANTFFEKAVDFFIYWGRQPFYGFKRGVMKNKFTDMGLKCWFFYSNVGDTTLKARAVSGQSIFVKKVEEKFYGKDKGKVIVS